MTQPDPDTARFCARIARATVDAGFFERFCDRFVGGNEDIGHIFRGKDMARIHRKLRTSIELSACSAPSAVQNPFHHLRIDPYRPCSAHSRNS